MKIFLKLAFLKKELQIRASKKRGKTKKRNGKEEKTILPQIKILEKVAEIIEEVKFYLLFTVTNSEALRSCGGSRI